jgi:hypothetical protein
MKYAWWLIVGLILFLICTQQAIAAEEKMGFDPTADYVIHTNPIIVEKTSIVPTVASTPEAGAEGKQYTHQPGVTSIANTNIENTDLRSVTYAGHQKNKMLSWYESFGTFISSSFSSILNTISKTVSGALYSLQKNVQEYSYQFVLALSKAVNIFAGHLTTWVNGVLQYLYENKELFMGYMIGGLALAGFVSTPIGKTFFKAVSHFALAGVVSAADLVIHTSSLLYGVIYALQNGVSVTVGYEAAKKYIKQKTGHDIGDFQADLQTVAIRFLVAAILYSTPLVVAGVVKAASTATLTYSSVSTAFLLRNQVALQKTAMDCYMPMQCDTLDGIAITYASNFLVGAAPSSKVVNKGAVLIEDEAKAVKGVLGVTDEVKLLEKYHVIKIENTTLNVSEHAIERMKFRDISISDIKEVVTKGQKFSYFHEGEMKTGYYSEEKRLFIGYTDKITTVIDQVNRNYINNIKKAK